MMVRKAIIPAAGTGTRMVPLSRAIPKEMLPVGLKPLLQYVIEEAASAGIQEIAIIISPDKAIIKKYFFTSTEPRNDDEKRLRQLIRSIRIRYIEQETPKGVADAISRAADFVGNEPFAYLLPDNFGITPTPFLKQMIEPFRAVKNNLIGLIEVNPSDAGIFGNSGRVDVEQNDDKLYNITRIYDKRPGSFPVDPSKPVIRAFARGILLPDFFELIEEYRELVDTESELDDVPILQQLALEKKLYGFLLEGQSFDTGNPYGYRKAVQTYCNLIA